MSRQWNIRKPGEDKVRCKGCGEFFYTHNAKKLFCTPACALVWQNRSETNKQKAHALRRAAITEVWGRRQRMFEFEIDPDTTRIDDPYARVADALVAMEDGTEDVLRMLSRGPVWAKHAECDMPHHWDKEILFRVEEGIARIRKNEEEWAKGQLWANKRVGMMSKKPRLPSVQVIKIEGGYAEPVTPPICDFCGDIGPSWQYGCADYIVEEIDSPFGGPCWASSGEFLACDECAKLIDKRYLANLLVRTAHILDNDPNLLEQSALIMQGFFENMDGTKEPFG